MRRYTLLLAELCFYLLIISSFANGENLSIPMPKYKPKHGTNIKTRDDLSPQTAADQPDESDNAAVSSTTTLGDVGDEVKLEDDTSIAAEITNITSTTTTTIATTTMEVAPQVILNEHNVKFCNKSLDEVLQDRIIFFMNPAEEDTEREILATENANDTTILFLAANDTIQFLDQIGHMLNCTSDGIQNNTFPAHYSYDNRTLTDVYVAIRKRESPYPLQVNEEMDDMTKNNLIFDMLEHYLSRMPRSHYGYEAPESRETPHCLDEAGYITFPLGEANTCFSLWMARNRNETSNKNEPYVDYYGGQLAFNRVDQDEFLMPDKMSIPQYFYSKGMSPCYVFNENMNLTEGDPKHSCRAFISADIYALLCCCYKELWKCHLPNPRSMHYRNLEHPLQDKMNANTNGFRLSCAVGNPDYAAYLKREKKNENSTVNFLEFEDSTVLTNTIGERCKIVYTFNGNDKNNFEMLMSASDKEGCPQLSTSQFLCEIPKKICPTEKLTYDSNFEVRCCCGGDFADNQIGTENMPTESKVTDLCNLDFLSHKVQDRFEDVFSTQPCSYSKHFHRLFGAYKEEKLYCVVQYDIGLNRTMFFLDGNNFQLMFDKNARSHRDYSEVGHLVFGKVLTGPSDCPEYDPYDKLNTSRYRAVYLQKCDPIAQNGTESNLVKCDSNMENETSNDYIPKQFEMNKDKVMRKCLKFATNDPVASKVQLEKQLGQNKQYIHADVGFMCFANIQSTITRDYLESANISIRRMYHKIEAGPITKDHIKNSANDRGFYNKCISAMEKFNDNPKDHIFDDYCEFTPFNPKASASEQDYGTLNGTLFCCCFVGFGWEHCNIEKRIVNYVDSYDLYRDNYTIKALHVTQQKCDPLAINSNLVDLKGKADKFKNCTRRQGCFQIRDVINSKKTDARMHRFEIWGGCVSHIDEFALLSARSRLAYLCTTPDMEKVAQYGTKCLAVQKDDYFTLFPPINRTSDPATDHEKVMVICCCAKECDEREVGKKYGEYYRIKDEK